jgi:hypothetical protein
MVIRIVLMATILLGVPQEGRASCNLLAAAPKPFCGRTGIVNRPYVGPEEDITLTCSGCTLANPVVSLIFKPPAPSPGAKTFLVLAKDAASCGVVDQKCQNDGCQCLCSIFPGTPILGPSSVEFEFVATSLAGPVTLAVSEPNAVRCSLVADTCETAGTGLPICIDELFDRDSSGQCSHADPHPVFPDFTALPASNAFRNLCTADLNVKPKCNPKNQGVEMAVDKQGNLLLPIKWGSILKEKGKSPVQGCLTEPCDNRLLQCNSAVSDSKASSNPIEVPSVRFLGSFNRFGTSFSTPPQFQPAPGSPKEFVVVGEADKKDSVLRIARRRGICDGTAEACTTDSDCSSGSCKRQCEQDPTVQCNSNTDCGASGPCKFGKLFEFRDRMSDQGTGPVVIPRVLSVGDPQGFGPGVCENDTSVPCTDSSPCKLGSGPAGECVLFRAEASVFWQRHVRP